ncbi:MAG: hypothetical protein HY742_09360 [Deltaproteobacteria bacterium]|nr:hypothetical protein [Deltaproteobacteria bacterium]
MRHMISFCKPGLPVRLASLLLVVALAGCASIRLIADYDEQIDKSVSELQRKCETFLTGLERNVGKPEAGHDTNTKFYDEAKVDLSAIRVRAAAISKNEITLKQLDLLADSLDKLEQLHKGGLRREQIKPLRSAFNASFTAILKLELAKKRGESPDK